jgi:hypothetical protein
MTEVLIKEVEYVKKYFASFETEPLKDVLYHYLAEYSNRYEKDANTKFMLRICFLPPSHLYEEVMNQVYSYLDTFEELLTAIFTKERVISVEVSEAAIAYMGLVDAVLVEMLYGGKERFNKRLAPCWNVFWNGISQ